MNIELKDRVVTFKNIDKVFEGAFECIKKNGKDVCIVSNDFKLMMNYRDELQKNEHKFNKVREVIYTKNGNIFLKRFKIEQLLGLNIYKAFIYFDESLNTAEEFNKIYNILLQRCRTQ